MRFIYSYNTVQMVHSNSEGSESEPSTPNLPRHHTELPKSSLSTTTQTSSDILNGSNVTKTISPPKSPHLPRPTLTISDAGKSNGLQTNSYSERSEPILMNGKTEALNPKFSASSESDGSYLVHNPELLAEHSLNSPHFTNPPPCTKGDDLAEMESLLDDSTDDDPKDDTLSGSKESLTMFEMENDEDLASSMLTDSDDSYEEELQRIRDKHEDARRNLIAQQKQELEELATRQKQRRSRARKSDDESSVVDD